MGLRSKRSHRKEGFFEVKHLYASKCRSKFATIVFEHAQTFRTTNVRLHKCILVWPLCQQTIELNRSVAFKMLINQPTTTRGGARNFPTGGLTLPTRGLKYGFQGTINAKNLPKIAFRLPTGASML